MINGYGSEISTGLEFVELDAWINQGHEDDLVTHPDIFASTHWADIFIF
jgi:hypothetical protein